MDTRIFKYKPLNIIAAIATVIGTIFAVINLDARYAKEHDVETSMQQVEINIVKEMRTEIVKNRGVMINNMQREADDIEYEMTLLEANNQNVPRYLSDKFKQITRQIEDLRNETNNSD